MLRRTCVLVMVLLVLAAGAMGAWSAQTKPVPPDVQLVDKASLAGAHPRVGVAVSWPTEKEFKEKGAPSPPDWPYALDKILRPDVVPDKLRESLVMVKGFPVEMRSGRIGRWEMGKYQIQVAELTPFAATVILVKDTKAKPSAEEAACQALFKQVMKDLFQHAEEAVSVPYVVAEKYTRSAAFMVTPVRQAVPKKIAEEWYGRLQWWSDGQSVVVWVWRQPGGSPQPKTIKVPVTVETVKPGEKPQSQPPAK